MEWLWNFIHYFFYRVECKFGRILEIIFLIYKLPCIKKLYKKNHKGRDIDVNKIKKISRQLSENRKTGLSSLWAWGHMFFLSLILCFTVNKVVWSLILPPNIGIFDIIESIHVLNMKSRIFIACAILVAIAYLLNHLLVFRKDKYLAYFKEFDKMETTERRKWYLISFIIIVSIIASFILCLKYLCK
jgi:hypothetical protein